MSLEIKRDVELTRDEFQMLAGTDMCATMMCHKYTFTDPMLGDTIRDIATRSFHIKQNTYPRKDFVVYFLDHADLQALLVSTPKQNAAEINKVVSTQSTY